MAVCARCLVTRAMLRLLIAVANKVGCLPGSKYKNCKHKDVFVLPEL